MANNKVCNDFDPSNQFHYQNAKLIVVYFPYGHLKSLYYHAVETALEPDLIPREGGLVFRIESSKAPSHRRDT